MSEYKSHKIIKFKLNGKDAGVLKIPHNLVEKPLFLALNASATSTKKKCQHLGVQTRKTKNELCGCENKYEPVYQCLHFGGETTTTQYKHNQPERCCIGCPAGPFSADF